jgi:hypothetical protein
MLRLFNVTCAIEKGYKTAPLLLCPLEGHAEYGGSDSCHCAIEYDMCETVVLKRDSFIMRPSIPGTERIPIFVHFDITPLPLLIK